MEILFRFKLGTMIRNMGRYEAHAEISTNESDDVQPESPGTHAVGWSLRLEARFGAACFFIEKTAINTYFGVSSGIF